MIISISNAVAATQIFIVLFLLALAISFRKRTASDFFSTALTQELKGVAILTIIFAHIGYFLVSDTSFLFPLSIAAGVGVNLFLFLSGYGLVMSSLAKQYSIKQFYLRRLPKLYLPFWLACALFFLLDFFVSGKTYGWTYVGQTFLGYFPRADLYVDLNSPFWYFTFIVLCYLLFPLVFSRRRPWLTAIIMYLAGYALIAWSPAALQQVIGLYRVHILAFPLGILFGSIVNSLNKDLIKERLNKVVGKVLFLRLIKPVVYWLLVVGLMYGIGFTAYNSHVGDFYRIEEAVSMVTVALLVALFIIKKIENRLLYVFGAYSYEIYLLHWPIMARFDIFYRFLPAWLATCAYLALFIGAGWLLRFLTGKVSLLGGYFAEIIPSRSSIMNSRSQ